MKKIISLFKRNYSTDRKVRDEVTPGAEWVIQGEGVATRKFDGTCCLVENGRLYKRYDHKPDNWKAIQRAIQRGGVAPDPIMSSPPPEFSPAQPPDPVTMHWPGWMPVTNSNEDAWHRGGMHSTLGILGAVPDGTYELCGPKIGGNPEGFKQHVLVTHGAEVLSDAPRDFEGLRKYLSAAGIEGIVWHHPDGRMVKIKAKDFPAEASQ